MEFYLPEITYEAAALTEWTACVLYWIRAPKRFEKWKTALMAALLLAGQVYLHTHIFIWLPSYLFSDSGFGILLIRMIGIAANVLFMFAGTALLCRYPAANLVYVTANAFVVAELTASAACLLYDLWVLDGGSIGTVEEICFYGGMCVLCLLCLGRSLNRESAVLNQKQITANQAAAVVLIAFLAFFVSNISIVLTGMVFSSRESVMNRAVLRVVGDLCGFMTLWVLSKGISEEEIKEELSAIQSTMDLQYQQYLTFRDTSAYIARQNHDLKHQIRALKESATEEERNAYIAEMEQVIALNEAWNATGNGALDSILTQKKMYCISHEITFTCQVNIQDIRQISVRDISSLFGNIIDNAIEYVSGFDDAQKRVIRGCVETKRSFLIAEFENYYEGPPVRDGRLPATTKQDKEMHGIGLKSIRYVAEKYGGNLSVNADGAWFTVRVMIPLGM